MRQLVNLANIPLVRDTLDRLRAAQDRNNESQASLQNSQDISNQRQYELGQEKFKSGLQNPIEQAAKGMALQGVQGNVPQPYSQAQGATTPVPPQYQGQGAPQSQGTPTAQPQDPYEAAKAQAAALRQERAQFEASKNSPQSVYASMYAPEYKAKLAGQEEQLSSREKQADAALGLAKKAKIADILGQAETAMQPPKGGWNPLSGAKSEALYNATQKIPKNFLSEPDVKEWLAFQKAGPQNTVFNPAGMMGANNRLVGTYVSKFDHAQEQYEKKVTPLQNLIETKNSPTWGTAAGDVSLINQLSLAEFGGYKPSEAEYKAFGKGFTPAEYAQKWLSWAQSGSVLPEKVRENMTKEVENVAKRSHENFKATMAEQKKRVAAAGVNPDEVVYPGGTYQNLEEYFGKNKAQPAKAAAGQFADADKEARYQAWKKANGK